MEFEIEKPKTNFSEIVFITLSGVFIAWVVVYINIFLPQVMLGQMTANVYNAVPSTMVGGSTEDKLAYASPSVQYREIATQGMVANAHDGVFVSFTESNDVPSVSQFVLPITFVALILAVWAFFTVQMDSMVRRRIPVEKRRNLLSWEK